MCGDVDKMGRWAAREAGHASGCVFFGVFFCVDSLVKAATSTGEKGFAFLPTPPFRILK